MDLRTAAAYLGCSYWTLRDLVLNGHIPAVRIPSPPRDGRVMRRILIDSRDLERLIERWKEVDDSAPSSTSQVNPETRREEARMRMTYKRGTVWWVKYYRNGRPIRESSHTSKESDAINLLKLREGDLAHGPPVNPKLNRIRVDEAAEDLKTEYAVNGRRSADELERRVRLHLLPYFGGRRLASITTADVNAFILKRQKDVMIVGEDDQREERRYSNGEINRELTTLKRILNLSRQNGKLMHVPHVPMLKERNVRTGFFEREQIERILALLSPAIRPAVQFAHVTGWRIPSEVLKLQWRHVDFEARVVPSGPAYDEERRGPNVPVHPCPGAPPGRLRRWSTSV
jgi:excisionase family DNA binding protein